MPPPKIAFFEDFMFETAAARPDPDKKLDHRNVECPLQFFELTPGHVIIMKGNLPSVFQDEIVAAKRVLAKLDGP